MRLSFYTHSQEKKESRIRNASSTHHTRAHTRGLKKKKHVNTVLEQAPLHKAAKSNSLFLFILIPQSSSFNLGAPGKVNNKKKTNTKAARRATHQRLDTRTRHAKKNTFKSSHQQRSNWKKPPTVKMKARRGVIGDVDLPRGHQSCLRFPVTKKPGHV